VLYNVFDVSTIVNLTKRAFSHYLHRKMVTDNVNGILFLVRKYFIGCLSSDSLGIDGPLLRAAMPCVIIVISFFFSISNINSNKNSFCLKKANHVKAWDAKPPA